MMLPMSGMKGIADADIHSIVETARYQYKNWQYYNFVGDDNEEEECDQRYDDAAQKYRDSGTRQLIDAAPPDDDAMAASFSSPQQ